MVSVASRHYYQIDLSIQYIKHWTQKCVRGEVRTFCWEGKPILLSLITINAWMEMRCWWANCLSLGVVLIRYSEKKGWYKSEEIFGIGGVCAKRPHTALAHKLTQHVTGWHVMHICYANGIPKGKMPLRRKRMLVSRTHGKTSSDFFFRRPLYRKSEKVVEDVYTKIKMKTQDEFTTCTMVQNAH